MPSYNRKRKAIRYLMILAIFPLTIMLSQLYTTYNTIKHIDERSMEQAEQIKDRQWDLIENVIYENKEKSKLQAEKVKTEISLHLLEAYKSDLSSLHRDLIMRNDSKLFSIINSSINGVYLNADNENNRIFVADKKGIIADRGYVSSQKHSRDWNTEIASKLNSESASKSVGMILTKNKELIFWEPEVKPVTPYDSTDLPTIESMKKVFKTQGIEALRNYDILVPAYITNEEDIFGVPDVDSHGKRINNDKIIVVQEFNIYDAIMIHRDDIERYDAYIEQCRKSTDIAVQTDMESFVLLMIINFIALLATLYGANIYMRWGGKDDTYGADSEL